MRMLLLVFLSLVAIRAWSVEVLTDQYEVLGLIPAPSGVSVQLNPNPAVCTSSWWGTQAIIRTGTANYQTLVAGITSAFMSNKKITAIHYNVLGDGSCSNSNELDIIAYKIVR